MSDALRRVGARVRAVVTDGSGALVRAPATVVALGADESTVTVVLDAQWAREDAFGGRERLTARVDAIELLPEVPVR
jgi:hypothetical protein